LHQCFTKKGKLDNYPLKQTYPNQYRSNEEPAQDKESGGTLSSHVLHVPGQASTPVQPAQGEHFEECQEHERDYSGVTVHQSEDIYSSLRRGGEKSKKEFRSGAKAKKQRLIR